MRRFSGTCVSCPNQKGGTMKSRYGIAATILLAVTIGSINAAAFDMTFERYFLDKEGGAIEVQVTHPGDKETLDAARQQLQEEARSGIPSSPALQQHEKQ